MKNGKFMIVYCMLYFTWFNVSAQEESQQLKIVRNMIDAVNHKPCLRKNKKNECCRED